MRGNRDEIALPPADDGHTACSRCETLVEQTTTKPDVPSLEEILCGPRPDALPDDASSRSRLLAQLHTNRLKLIAMIESILGTKEEANAKSSFTADSL